MITTVALKHLATSGNVLVGRKEGKEYGITTPLRLYFELKAHYDISECNGTESKTVDVIYPSGTYEDLDYIPSWEHHRFYGWYTTATTPSQLEDTSGISVTSADSIVYDIKTVYARWQIPATVSFDATTGGGMMPSGWTAPDYYVGQPFGSLPEPTKSGEVFLGWFTSGGTRVTESSAVPSSTVVLTARYQAVTYATKLEVQPTSSYTKFGIYSTTARDASAPTVVDWGDGKYDVVYGNISQLVHEYASAGTYEVGISDSISSFGISTNDSTWYGTTSQVRYTMKKVKTISSNIMTYPSHAFYYCSAMTDVLFPSNASFTSIPTYCFYYCSSLKNITIPSTVTTISSYAFAYCNGSSFNTITIPATVTSIQNNAFYYCYYLNNITFESGGSLTLGTYTFSYCGYYSAFDIDMSPRTITSIPSYCFSYCRYLRNFTWPQNCTSINSYAFQYCNQSTFTSITIPATITNIGSYAFYYCYYLTNVTFESSETTLSLGTYAFAYCGYYSKLDIDLSPRIITSISNYCFYYCRYLGTVTFPRNCTSIGTYAFYHAWEQSGVGSPTFTIPEGITSIGQYAFAYTYYLAGITIPSTCSTINNYAFYYAQRLATITCNRTTAPTVYSGTFGNSNTYYTGRNSYSAGTNKLVIPVGATGYDSSYWADPLCNSSKCGFHIEYGGTEVTITFDATTNGGQMPSGWVPPTYYEGVPYGTLPTPTKTGEYFDGWYDGDTLVTTSSLVPVDGATLVARYTSQAPDVLLYPYATSSDSWGSGYVSSAGTTYSGDGGTIRPYMAFKEGIPSQSYNDAWSSTKSTDDWLQIKLESAKVCRKFGYCTRYGFFANCFQTAQLLGSNDGTNFTQLAALSISTQPTTSDEIVWDIPNTTSYLYYRLHIDNCFADRISVGRLRLYGYE